MGGLAEICLRRPVFAVALILALATVGVLSYFSLGVDLYPRGDFPAITITVANSGASPEEIEAEITEKVESAVSSINGVEELRSTSAEGVSRVFITFSPEKNPDAAANETRERVEFIRAGLPYTAGLPVVAKHDAQAAPALRLVVTGSRNLRELTGVTDRLVREPLEGVSGVGKVQLIGGVRREIQIRIDPNRLRAYNLTASEVAAAVRSQNLTLTGGLTSGVPRELSVRALGRISAPEQFNDIVVATREGFPVKVRDIGQVVDDSEEMRAASLINGRPAVSLLVSKQSGRNTVAVAGAVKTQLAEIRQTLPPGFQVEIIGDQSAFIRASIASLWKRLFVGGLLAALVVYLFLRSFRSMIIAALPITISIISTFSLMAAMNYTLNQVTLLALALVAGVVIGDAIVIMENIHRRIEVNGMPPFDAAIAATREIGAVAITTTIALLAIFLPLVFMRGGAGQLLSSFGLTATFAIVVSLLVSFTLTPLLSARLMRRRGDGAAGRQGESAIRNPQSAIDRAYTRALEWSLAHRRNVAAISVLTIASAIPLFMAIGKNLLPEDDQAQFEIEFRAPRRGSMPATMTVLGRVAYEARRLPGVTATLATAHSGLESSADGSIYVRLAPIEDRDLSQADLMARARELLARFPKEQRTSVGQVADALAGVQDGHDAQYVIRGPDLNKLTGYSEELLKRLKAIPFVVDADTSVARRHEMRALIDRRLAADLGASVSDIAQAMNILGAGQRVSSFSFGGDGSPGAGDGVEECDVIARATERFRAGKEDLRTMTIPSANGGVITLDQVVRIEESAVPSIIDRLNRQRYVTLSANVESGGSQSEIISRFDKIAREMKLAPGYTVEGDGKSKELGRTGYYSALAIALSFIFLSLVLAAHFNSFIQPAAVLLTLPIVVPFGLLSLLGSGQTINIFSGLWLLPLFGIVVRNAILQLDSVKRLRVAGAPRNDANIQASHARLRPFLMTIMAMLGFLALFLIPTGAVTLSSRIISALVAVGLSLCLTLTPFACLAFYSLFEDFVESPAWRRASAGYNRIKTGLRRRLAGVWLDTR